MPQLHDAASDGEMRRLEDGGGEGATQAEEYIERVLRVELYELWGTKLLRSKSHFSQAE